MYKQGVPIVIDNGSCYCKAGLSGDDAPRVSFPSIVGRPKYQNSMVGISEKDVYVGWEAQAKNGVLKLSYPIENGIIHNWDDMTKIWHHCFYNQLRVTPSEHPCLLTQKNGNPLSNRERMTEIMFETFDVPAFYLAKQTTLPLYSSGKTTGLVLDCGQGVTQVGPIYEGYSLSPFCSFSYLGGRDLTDYMRKILNSQGLNFSSIIQEKYSIQDIKEKYGYVALDFNQELLNYRAKNRGKTFDKLPDGQQIGIGTERFQCPQALFNPQLMGKYGLGIHEMIHQCIKKCDFDLQKHLYNNIVLCGGSSIFPGLPQRLTMEVIKLASTKINVKVFAPQERKFSTWIGGSILTSLSTFQSYWIKKEEYIEYGAQIVHRKCF